MRVSVIINPRAGAVKVDVLKDKISESLFRCELSFHIVSHRKEVMAFILSELEQKTNALMVCGGDGTVNETMQMVMSLKLGDKTPPLSIISSGTANDLSHELGISQRISEAARSILSGEEKKIDIIEAESNGVKKYMLTNGGFGIPAITADKANKLRSFLQKRSQDSEEKSLIRHFSKYTHRFVKKMGSEVYSTFLIQSLLKWDSQDWNVEIEFEDGKRKISKAPFLLINNQPYLGKKFLIAPYTQNTDGMMNLTLIESHHLLTQLLSVLKVLRGSIRESSIVNISERSAFTVRSLSQKRQLTFFGDGEILFRDVQEIKFKCHHQQLTIMV
ncbi:MAG: kinase [Bdellovibrionaceae bacterium]|nr:kinase [Pseudobdellovibrionaceae bacterium]